MTYPIDEDPCVAYCPHGPHLHYRDGWFLQARITEKRSDSVFMERLKHNVKRFRRALDRLSK